MSLTIEACQMPDVQGDTTGSLLLMKERIEAADRRGVDIVCFPECYLQGYTLDAATTKARAIDTRSAQFQDILNEFQAYQTTTIFGLIEVQGGRYFNSAAVVQGANLLGVYRKANLFETNFAPGDASPVFRRENTIFGVNICYDARFSAAAGKLAAKGVAIIFYPLNNVLLPEKAERYRSMHIANLIARAQETGCWVVSSDVTANEPDRLGFGCTAIVSPDGKVVEAVAELTVDRVTAKIDCNLTDAGNTTN